MSTGGGGMLFFQDKNLAKRASHLSTQAKSDGFWYDHDEVGYNYRMNSLSAALGLAQMEDIDWVLARKREIAQLYLERLSRKESLPSIPSSLFPNCWLNAISTARQAELIERMNKASVQVRPLWKPMHELKMFRQWEYVKKDVSISNKLHHSTLCLPSSPNLSYHEQEQIIQLFWP